MPSARGSFDPATSRVIAARRGYRGREAGRGYPRTRTVRIDPPPYISQPHFQQVAFSAPPIYTKTFPIQGATMYKKPLPPVERLRHLLSYDADTGLLTWRNPIHHKCAVGEIDPYGSQNGYKVVTIDRVTYLQHRVVWAMQTGYPPPDRLVIDHINENPTDNRWVNLRLLSNSENVSRSSRYKRAFSRWVTVQQIPSGRWHAVLRTKNPESQTSLGTFSSEAEARAADPDNPPPRKRGVSGAPLKTRIRKTRYGTYEVYAWHRGEQRKKFLGTYPTRELAGAVEVPDDFLIA